VSRLANLFLKDPGAAPAPEAPPARYRLLFVDDEPNVLRALQRIFRKENYEIRTAATAQEALRHFDGDRPPQLVISDHRMPGMTGAELLKRIKEEHPDAIRIMLTGHADVDAVMGAVKEGAVYKFITKPWNDEDLRITVALALEQYDLIQENRRLKEEERNREREIKTLRRFAEANRSQLGRFLVRHGVLAEADLARARKAQREGSTDLVRALLSLRLVTEDQVVAALVRELKLDVVSLPEWRVPKEVLAFLPRGTCEDAGILPLRVEGKKLVAAMLDPTDHYQLNELAFITGLEVSPVLARASELQAKIEEVFGEVAAAESVADLVAAYDPLDAVEVVLEEEGEEDLEALLRSKDQPPAIRIVNAILAEAVRLGASDVHIEPRTKHVAVRYRIDGLLTDKIQVPPSIHLSVVSRLKIMAELDIAERRRPQDGRITVKTARKIVDLRVSTLPTIQGEKVVLRILDRNAAVRRLSELGLGESEAETLRRLARRPQGIVLTTGPTGSGKTTTLYALLAESFDPRKNYVTIEDPVEYYLEQAGQVYVKERIGLNFASVLRSVLRQDPDVILLGEIRDLETAQVSFHAALTGHLVLSTLHTNSAAATVVRLLDLGLDRAVITAALHAIVSQRLVRRLCPACTAWTEPDPAVLAALNLNDLGRGWTGPAPAGRGCEECHGTGYRGRLALTEILEMSDPLRELVRGGASERELREAAREWGLRSLLEDGVAKAAGGLTTLEEVLRVLGPQGRATRPCPACGHAGELHHRACTACGAPLRRTCPACAAPLDPAWSFCPACASPANGGFSR
jgi:type II secretory ATPase GspE/PulE/Tfp pilus assembly ATPase PilB-like protein/FixJ family two-component response regulator